MESASYEQALALAQGISQRQNERRGEFEKFQKNTRMASALAILSIVAVAIICELLSIFALGWLLSWLFTLLMWFFIKRRIGKIDKATEEIEDFKSRVDEELAKKPGGSRRPQAIRSHVSSYTLTFIRDTLLTQGIELIPIIDMLPFYLGQLVKSYFDMKKRHKKVLNTVRECENIIQEIEAIENRQLNESVVE